MKYFFVAISFSLCLAGFGQGKSPWKFTLDSENEWRSMIFPKSIDSPQNQYELRGNHDITMRKGTSLKVNISGRTIFNTKNSRRTHTFLNEANISWNKSSFTTKIGKQTTKWGSLAGISTLDLANAYDYYDFLETDGEELGSWGVDLKIDNKGQTLHVRYFPYTEESKIYFENHHWTEIPASIPHPQYENVDIPMTYIDNLKMMKPSRSNLAIEYRARIFSFDINASYFNGINDVPLIRPIVEEFNEIPVPFYLGLYEHRLRTTALSISKMWGVWSFFTEAAHVKNYIINSSSQLTEDTYNTFSIGFDRVFFFENPEKMFRIMGQYRNTFSDNTKQYGPNNLDHVLDHCLLADIDWTLSYHSSISAQLVFSFGDFATLWRPKFNYKFSDQIHAQVGIDLMKGSENHFFGYHSKRSRLFFTIKTFI